jgi:hypothetical protein
MMEEKEDRVNGPWLRACHPMDGRALGADHRHQPDGSGVPVYQARTRRTHDPSSVGHPHQPQQVRTEFRDHQEQQQLRPKFHQQQQQQQNQRLPNPQQLPLSLDRRSWTWVWMKMKKWEGRKEMLEMKELEGKEELGMMKEELEVMEEWEVMKELEEWEVMEE